MGLLDKLRNSGRTMPSAPSFELAPDVIAAAQECHVTSRDVGRVTRGKGSAHNMSVAGTNHRADAMRYVAGLPLPSGQDTLPAVVLRDPGNPYDPDAVKVLVGGVHIGFLPAYNAKKWQGVLLECEKRGVLLVGTLRLVDRIATDGSLGAAISIRDALPGFEGTVSKDKAAERAKVKADKAERERLRQAAAVPLEGDKRNEVVDCLQRLARQDAATTKQKAGLVRKQLEEVLPALRGHADSLEIAGSDQGVSFGDLLGQVEGALEYLNDADDADEREDAHMDLQSEIEDLLAILGAPIN